MKRPYSIQSIIIVCTLLIPTLVLADVYSNLIEKGDESYNQLSFEGYKNSIPYYENALSLQPDSFEANWKCSRSYARYAAALKWESYKARVEEKKTDNWKKSSAALGDKGMAYAMKAQELDPKSVEGHYWLVRCILARVEGVSWFTAIREGFLPKTKKAINSAYDIDKSYFDFAPIFMRALFHAQPPWPLKNKKKSLKYYEEFKELSPNVEEKDERACFAAELLLQLKGEEYRKEAKELLEFAALSNERYFSDWAKSLLNKKFKMNYDIDDNATVGVGK